ncbi:MAG: nucleotidyl transferase AbiEii/AbiGii toxin family protein [bacterium]|nr:nucleotidyl transferase AbiEii/AbiGii toxin family protein [bacterium]
MANLFKQFLQLLKALDEYKVEYILIGGVAVIIHGLARLTRDIDLFIKPTVPNIQQLKGALNSIYHDRTIEEITIDDLQNYSVIRYGMPNGFYIDMMTRLGEAFSFDDLKYEIVEYKATKIRIATLESLYDLKKNSPREKDKMDASFLMEIIGKNIQKNS